MWFIQINSIKLHYKEFWENNSSQTFLILHGWWGSSDSWIQVSELLSRKWYRVIIPDLPWFGQTEIDRIFTLDDYAQLVEWLIRELWLKDFILMGHSNWWAISIKILNRWNIKPKKLILNNSAGIRNKISTNWKRKIYGMLIKPFKFIVSLPGGKKFRELFYRAIWSHDYLKASKSPYLKWTIQNVLTADLQEEMKNLDIDTLLIRGELDTYTPLSDGKLINSLIKKSSLDIIQWEKHWIHLHNPVKLVEVILEKI